MTPSDSKVNSLLSGCMEIFSGDVSKVFADASLVHRGVRIKDRESAHIKTRNFLIIITSL